MAAIPLTDLFHVDSLALIMTALIAFIGLVVASFATRYLEGDRGKRRFFRLLTALCVSLVVMVMSDHLLLLLIAMGSSNVLLVKLMVHKPEWRAARAAGNLAGRNFLFGFVVMALAFELMVAGSGEWTVQGVISHPGGSAYLLPSLLLLLLGAMAQSAIWPFNRWLLSSLNSPTPVSAFMHAGLVNGGGFVLARFAPLYLDAPLLLDLMLVAGLTTAMLGTLWKLMQQDVKRMLACSTMGQMGFMLVQCGLGLFPAAVAHLCWHGLFKAYLFLGSGAAAQERRLDLGYPPRAGQFLLAMLCGAVGSLAFAFVSHRNLFAGDSGLVLLVVAFIAGSQFAMPLLRQKGLARLPVAAVLTGAVGLAYGGSVNLIESSTSPIGLAQPLNALHLFVIALLLTGWLAVLYGRRPGGFRRIPDPVLRLYVRALNAGQPHPATVTSQRSDYQHA